MIYAFRLCYLKDIFYQISMGASFSWRSEDNQSECWRLSDRESFSWSGGDTQSLIRDYASFSYDRTENTRIFVFED
jgi:hypothetical protein